MTGKAAEIQKELNELVAKGHLLVYAMADDVNLLEQKSKEALLAKKIELPSFNSDYDPWYSVSIRVVRQLIPDRLDDFVAQYKQEKRKEVGFLTYTISDYLLGLKSTRGVVVVAEPSAALPKLRKQVAILESAKAVLTSKLVDLTEVLQADLFDTELQAAAELVRRGFTRAGGAMAGVVLEAHLKHVCDRHSLRIKKAKPTLSDLNQLLKDSDVIDTPKWRFIQHLTDVRNLCDHHGDREPTKEDVSELVEGVGKVSKTVF